MARRSFAPRHSITARLRGPAAAALAASALACSETAGPDSSEPVALALVPVAQGLSAPLYVTAPPGDLDRLFIVQRGGLVRVLAGGTLLPDPYLDLVGSVTGTGGEQGLLSIAFHPQYQTTGYVYASYTNTQGDTRIVRYTVSADPNRVDASSGDTILAVDQPYSNHNGGLAAFGPDGYLYVGLGDGGSGGDPHGHGQNLATLLGSMLRIDVDGAPPYAIPPDNPFVGHSTARPEAWAYGLRNPWRFSFDRQTGDLYIADVGQSTREEVSFQPASSDGGENYGWRLMEGSACYDPATNCPQTGLTLPVYEHGRADGCSITGGYVYRGSAYPTLRGRYFVSDYCGGWIRSFVVVNGVAEGLQDHSDEVATIPQVSSFGEDAAGELYVVSLAGAVYRITVP